MGEIADLLIGDEVRAIGTLGRAASGQNVSKEEAIAAGITLGSDLLFLIPGVGTGLGAALKGAKVAGTVGARAAAKKAVVKAVNPVAKAKPYSAKTISDAKELEKIYMDIATKKGYSKSRTPVAQVISRAGAYRSGMKAGNDVTKMQAKNAAIQRAQAVQKKMRPNSIENKYYTQGVKEARELRKNPLAKKKVRKTALGVNVGNEFLYGLAQEMDE